MHIKNKYAHKCTFLISYTYTHTKIHMVFYLKHILLFFKNYLYSIVKVVYICIFILEYEKNIESMCNNIFIFSI